MIFPRYTCIALLLWLTGLCGSATARQLPRLIPYRDGSLWGYCDTSGAVRIRPQWDEAWFFYGSKAVVVLYDNASGRHRYCLIDSAGQYIISPASHWDGNWRGWKTTGLNAHDDKGRYGLIDTSGRLLLPFVYDPPQPYTPVLLSDRYRPLARDGKWGLVSSNNEVLIPFRYEQLEELPGMDTARPAFKALDKGRWWLLDRQGAKILPAQYDYINAGNYPDGSPHVRQGYLLAAHRRVSRHDSSKGFITYHGWVDYPGGTYLAPRYRAFNFLSDKYYVADGRLYDEHGKGVLTGRYRNFYRSQDTIFGTRARRAGRDSLLIIRHAFDLQTLAPLRQEEHRQARIPLHMFMREQAWVCGTGARIAQRAQAREAARPEVRLDSGAAVKDFVRDSIGWHTNFYIRKDRIAVYGYHQRTGAAYQGVTDGQGHFLFPPFREQASIAALNLEDRLLVLQTYHSPASTYYAIADLQGRILVPFGPKILSCAFRDSSGTLLVVAADVLPQPGVTIRFVDDEVYQERPAYTPANARVCDQDLQPLPALQAYCFRALADTDLEAGSVYTGYIRVVDTAQRTGYVNLKGTVQLKALSFRYRNLTSYGRYVFLAEEESVQQLVGRDGRLLMPDRAVTGVRLLRREQPAPTGELLRPDMAGLPLLQVYYRVQNTSRFFFMSENGRRFAGTP